MKIGLKLECHNFEGRCDGKFRSLEVRGMKEVKDLDVLLKFKTYFQSVVVIFGIFLHEQLAKLGIRSLIS